MASKLKQRIADILFPGWRNDELVTSMLAYEARLRADPERRALKRRINRQLCKGLASGLLVGSCALLVALFTCVCWLAEVPVKAVVASLVFQQFACALGLSAATTFLLLAPWR
jgi:hypothetical protein